MRRLPPALLAAFALAVVACGGSDGGAQASTGAGTPEPAPATTAATTTTPDATATATRRTVATGLHVPWGIAFLPDGAALVSERTTGRILRIPRQGGGKRVVMRVPGVDTGAGEGGLLGIAVSPGYARDGLVYAYYTTGSDNRIARFRLGGRPQVILDGLGRGTIHNGGRIGFGPDGKLYAGVGDTGDTDLAQDPGSGNGKILRMNPDGSVPSDNPTAGSLVWSQGHRNVQGLAWDRAGRLWATEFGQNTFDEVNLIRPGRDYGWPDVEGRGDTAGGAYTNPLVTWSTDQASPSGAAIVGRTLYVAALRGERLWRIPLQGTRAGRPQALLTGRLGRLRTVVRAPGGTAIWVATSNTDGRGTPRGGDDRIISIPVR